MRRLVLVTVCLFTLFAAGAEPAFKAVTGPRDWSFPRDHGRHDGYKIEWWYFTGNCRDAAGHRLGYQLTFFRTALSPTTTTRPSAWAARDVYFAHLAVTDIDGKHFAFKDRLERGRPGLAEASDRTLDVSLLDWSCKLDAAGAIHLLASDGDLKLDLTCQPGRGPVLEGPGGVNAKGTGVGQASYYYSMTRLQTAGTIAAGGKAYAVTGLGWMDHEFSSNALSADQVGWDWMGLHLTDGTDLMIYRLRTKSGGTDYLSGTGVTADGRPHYLAAADLSLAGSDPWTSPTSGGRYPQTWAVTVNGRPLTVRSALPGQELVTNGSTRVTYFEGAADVVDAAGRPAGEGYLEMTGYAKPVGDGR